MNTWTQTDRHRHIHIHVHVHVCTHTHLYTQHTHTHKKKKNECGHGWTNNYPRISEAKTEGSIAFKLTLALYQIQNLAYI